MRRHICGAIGLYRAQLSDVADLALTDLLLSIATNPDNTTPGRTEAWNAAARWARFLAVLHGLDRDPKTDPLYASMLPPPQELVDAVTDSQQGSPLGTYTNSRQRRDRRRPEMAGCCSASPRRVPVGRAAVPDVAPRSLGGTRSTIMGSQSPSSAAGYDRRCTVRGNEEAS